MDRSPRGRRAVIAGLGAVASAGVWSGGAAAQTGPAFAPTMHREDDWMSSMRGKHRVVVDVTTPQGMPDAIRFAGNLFIGHKTGYGLEESDVAILVCLRHSATAYGYDAGIWSKHGKVIDAAASPVPTANPFNTADRPQLGDLAKRGVQFMVCGTASRGLAGRIAGPGGDAEAVLKEMGANLIPSARIVAAGVVGVTHAQERGFALLYVG